MRCSKPGNAEDELRPSRNHSSTPSGKVIKPFRRVLKPLDLGEYMAKLSALTSYCAQHAIFYRTELNR
jgi:hypothetical protein